EINRGIRAFDGAGLLGFIGGFDVFERSVIDKPAGALRSGKQPPLILGRVDDMDDLPNLS
ncbi:MAG: hypothetical protein RL333_314, partial [Pseudomonadota bacterium]